VRGGLRLEEGSDKQWWAERWLLALDEFSIGHRQVRGKRYALQGQVVALNIEKGVVRSLVQGTRREPYQIVMEATTLSDEQWQKVFSQLRNELSDVSKLLAGTMPHGLEHIFRNAGLSLFPRTEQDLMTQCSCPDSSNPCKHIAAVHYLLAQEFARDPFLILKLRGLDKEELLYHLGLGTLTAVAPEEENDEDYVSVVSFWTGRQGALPPLPSLEGPLITHMALIKQLGPFPMWRGNKGIYNELKGVYASAQARAVNLLASQDGEI